VQLVEGIVGEERQLGSDFGAAENEEGELASAPLLEGPQKFIQVHLDAAVGASGGEAGQVEGDP